MALYQIDNVASPIDFQEDDLIKRTLQNAKNLLMCQMGEVPYGRYRGFDSSLFDLPIEEFNEELMPVLDIMMQLEPDVEVDSAEATLLEDGSTYIKVILKIDIGEPEDEEEEENG